MLTRPISRRDFLKLGCLTTAAAGVAVCGASAALPIPDECETDFPSSSYGDKNMSNRILVIYASGLGSTAEIAVAIGETLGNNGVSVDVKPIQENPRIEDYQTVLLGSAVRHGNWLPEAVDFVKANQGILNKLPLALFTVHITNLGNDSASVQNRKAFLNQVRPLLQPVDEVFFAGKFDRRGAALLLPGLLAHFVPTMDFRDFKKVRAWTESIRPRLVKQVN